MKIKRKARETAFKILFAVDVGKSSLPDVVSLFQYEPPVAMNYALKLVNGILGNLKNIDEKIVSLLENWDFNRVSVPDKEVLRLALYEIDFENDIDDGLAVFEAVEIAKKYGTKNSKDFVNGILRSYLRRKQGEPETT
jgi:N utilization substance protein B